VDLDFFSTPTYPVLIGQLEDIRRAGRAVRNDLMNGWMVSGYEDIRRVLGDTNDFTSEGGPFAAAFGDDAMLALDGPFHKTIRDVWAKAFTAKELERERQMLKEIAKDKIVAMRAESAKKGETDIMVWFVDYLTDAFLNLSGADETWRDKFANWTAVLVSQGQVALPDDHPRMVARREVRKEMYGMLEIEVERRLAGTNERGSPFDLIGLMVAAEGVNGIGRPAVLDNLASLVLGGTDNTSKWFGNTIMNVYVRNQLADTVAGNPNCIPRLFEESMRIESVVQIDVRNVKGYDVHIGDTHLPKGDAVYLMLGAGNRDPDAFARPDSFELDRKTKLHLGFGYGLHACLGLALARIEACAFMDVLFETCPDLTVNDVDYYPGWTTWGPKSMSVTVN
jgi:cytochrome P450